MSFSHFATKKMETWRRMVKSGSRGGMYLKAGEQVLSWDEKVFQDLKVVAMVKGEWRMENDELPDGEWWREPREGLEEENPPTVCLEGYEYFLMQIFSCVSSFFSLNTFRSLVALPKALYNIMMLCALE